MEQKRREERERIAERERKRRQRFERKRSVVQENERDKMKEFMTRESSYNEYVEGYHQSLRCKKEIKHEIKRMKSEGITENMERLKRAASLKVEKFGEKMKTRNQRLLQMRGGEKNGAKLAYTKFQEKEKLTQAADLIPLAKNSSGFMKYGMICWSVDRLLSELNVQTPSLPPVKPKNLSPRRDYV